MKVHKVIDIRLTFDFNHRLIIPEKVASFTCHIKTGAILAEVCPTHPLLNLYMYLFIMNQFPYHLQTHESVIRTQVGNLAYNILNFCCFISDLLCQILSQCFQC